MFVWIILALTLWIVGPTIYDWLGYAQRKNLDVFDSYCKLQVQRKYKATWKDYD